MKHCDRGGGDPQGGQRVSRLEEVRGREEQKLRTPEGQVCGREKRGQAVRGAGLNVCAAGPS